MKTVILCGGKGTRIGEVTQNLIPKPMVEIGGTPIIKHIMKYYSSYGYKDFVLCAGYLSWSIKSYFLHLSERHQDITINYKANTINSSNEFDHSDWTVTIAETGVDTMTAGRLKRVYRYLDDESFLLTYGDGVSDVNIDELVAFHESHGKGLTITGVVPPGRFGEMEIEDSKVKSWSEKPSPKNHFINGGYMVMRRAFLEKYVLPYEDSIMLEREPFEQAALDDEMMIYRHEGFWQCMDTSRDWNILTDLWLRGDAPWCR